MNKTIKKLRLSALLVLSALPLMSYPMNLSADRGGDREDFDLYDRNRLQLDFDPYDTEQEKNQNQQNKSRRSSDRNDSNQGNSNYNPYSNQNNSNQNNSNRNTTQSQNKETPNSKKPNLQNQEADLYDRNRLQLDFSPYDTRQEQRGQNSNRSDNNYRNNRNDSQNNNYGPDNRQNNSNYNQDNNYYYPNTQQAG